MAEVYLAHDQELDRNVALKVLRHQYADDERFVERFKREARNAASLSHPNIVAVHDRGETQDGAYYIVMEYMAGGTLKDRIEREGPLPAPVATALALQIAKALEAAHRRGVIHRDIKPQNVLLDEVGEAKVADFGIARAASSSTMTKVGSVMGTTHYISPEQALGEAASPRSDLYSLGVVLYEMLTGELPYDAETPMGVAMQHVSGKLRPPREVRPEVPEGINAVTVRLLAKDPEERYGSAAELVEDLERVQRGVAPVPGAATPQAVAPVSTPPAHPPADRVAGERPRAQGPSEAPTVPQPVRPAGPAGGRGPLRWLLVAAALLGVLVVVGLGIVAWLLVPSPQQEGADLEVPSLEGMELAAARQEVGDDFELVSSERNSTEPKGTILEQRPEPGAEARKGEEISVVVSAGSGTAAVPRVVGKSRDEAEQTLESEGFEVRVETRRSSEEVAGRVVEQSPSEGEAKLGSEVEITVTEGPPPGYKYIEDPTGNFTAEVPSGWGVETGENSEKDAGPNTWSYVAGEYLISSLTTAADLDAWYSTGTSGVYMVASKSLTQYSDYELTHSFLNANKNELCATTGPYEDYNRSPYSGKIQTWYECGVDAATTFAVAAAPEGRECVVVLNARISDEADREAIEHIIDTFEVNCGGIAGA
jgi:serine/threonine-protein kinase